MKTNFLTELCQLRGKKIVLASQSPRRIEMLRSVGLQFEIRPATLDEQFNSSFTAVEYVRHLASEKAHQIWQTVDADLVIAADTVVTLNGQVFEKPKHRSDARRMLEQLSNRTHEVITGLCLIGKQREVIDHEITQVTFYPLTEQEIEIYLSSQEPFDKAGAYGIQGFASLFIKKIDGCYFNVVGFPLGKFYQHLKQMKI